MAYYTALINAWNTSSASPGALPSGVVGTSLNGLNTAAKIVAVNAWTVTGTIPTSFYVSGPAIANCVNWTEFNNLTAAQQSNVLTLCANPGQLLGGSGNTSFLVDGMIIAYFFYSNPITGAISGTTLTVTVAGARPLLPGATLSGNGVAAGTTVVSGPSNGGTGSYVVSISQTVSSGSISVTGPTVSALTALASAQVQLWWGVSVANGGGGLSGVVNQTDVTLAGLS